MRDYEIVLIFAPNLEEEAREAILKRIDTSIEESGELVLTDPWGMRKLAYEINDFTDGYYVIKDFKSDSETVNELDRICKISDGVIRHMIVRKDD